MKAGSREVGGVEGGNASLSCFIKAGSPTPAITWARAHGKCWPTRGHQPPEGPNITIGRTAPRYLSLKYVSSPFAFVQCAFFEGGAPVICKFGSAPKFCFDLFLLHASESYSLNADPAKNPDPDPNYRYFLTLPI